jgi:hypothetical protein
MAWETRGTRPYYYKSRRIGNTVRKLYVGSGEVAKQAAAKDAAAKVKRAADQTSLAEFKTRLANVDQLAADVDQGVRLLMEAALLTAGFREHRGEWRLSRD